MHAKLSGLFHDHEEALAHGAPATLALLSPAKTAATKCACLSDGLYAQNASLVLPAATLSHGQAERADLEEATETVCRWVEHDGSDELDEIPFDGLALHAGKLGVAEMVAIILCLALEEVEIWRRRLRELGQLVHSAAIGIREPVMCVQRRKISQLAVDDPAGLTVRILALRILSVDRHPSKQLQSWQSRISHALTSMRNTALLPLIGWRLSLIRILSR